MSLNVMLNPECVILNLVQNLFRAGLFQHLIKIICYETLNQSMKQVQDKVQGDKIKFVHGSYLPVTTLTSFE